MRNHIISKDATNALKGIAVIIIVLGHFAFLSGYGTLLSYIDHDEKIRFTWFIQKIIRVYVPFLLVNIISLPLYSAKWSNIVEKILLESNDSIMWYPIFVMSFYLLFYIVAVIKTKLLIKVIFVSAAEVAGYIVMAMLQIPHSIIQR